MMELTEDEVKKDILKHLEELRGYGKLWYERMNVGVFGPHHNIQGARKGTADFIVVQGGEVQMVHAIQKKVHKTHPVAFVTFIECKSSDGKQKPDQFDFEAEVAKFNCRYAIVRSVDDLMEVLKRE